MLKQAIEQKRRYDRYEKTGSPRFTISHLAKARVSISKEVGFLISVGIVKTDIGVTSVPNTSTRQQKTERNNLKIHFTNF